MNKNQRKQHISPRASSRAGEILQRLPLHRNLSESQAMIVRITSYWQRWLAEAKEQNHLSLECCKSTRLEAWQPTKASSQTKIGKLIISCDNASNATQVKQQKHSLMEFLNENLIQTGIRPAPISNVVVRLRTDDTQLNLNVKKPDSSSAIVPVTESSIRAIEVCQKSVSNEELAESLKQLAKTLRSLN